MEECHGRKINLPLKREYLLKLQILAAAETVFDPNVPQSDSGGLLLCSTLYTMHIFSFITHDALIYMGVSFKAQILLTGSAF